MKVFHTFFCFLFMALQDGITEFVTEENQLFRRLEGENITVTCSFTVSGFRRLFCKDTCEDGNILIETLKDTAEKGRYSIKYDDKPYPSDNFLHVSIKQLKKSDSGRYRCLVDLPLLPDPSWDFKIIVKEASTTSQPKSTLPTFPPSTFLPSASTESSEQLDSSPPRSDLHLYMGLILVVKIFILSIPLMILCKKRRSTKPEVPPVETIYVNVSESNRVVEEIVEDRQISSPLETSSPPPFHL